MSTIERKARLGHDKLMEAAGFSRQRVAQQVVDKAAEKISQALAERTAGGKPLVNPRDLEVDEQGDLVFVYDVELPDDVLDVDA